MAAIDTVDEFGNPIPTTPTPDPTAPTGGLAHSFAYWAGLGVQIADIMDQNGSGAPTLKPGWTFDPADGYAYNGKWDKPTGPPSTPPPGQTPPPPGPGGPGGPSSQFPGFGEAGPGATTSPGFVPPEWHSPTFEEAGKDPGYQFAVGQGTQAMEQSAAGRGVLNTGGTLKDLLAFGQAAGATQFQNVWDRNMAAYKQAYGAAWDANTSAQHNREIDWSHAFDKWMADYSQFHNEQTDRWGRYRDATQA